MVKKEKMALEEIAERVKKIIAEQLNANIEEVVPTADFIDDLGSDSLETTELIMLFEKEFVIVISDDDAMTIRTVQDAIDLVAKMEPVV